MARDYYEVLGVSRDATADQIQQAFRKLARKHHPDVNKDPAAEDRFKEVNDTLGHANGDRLLVALAERLSAGMRATDTLARLGGDEFGVVLDGVHGPGEAVEVLTRLRSVLTEPVVVDGLPLTVEASVGFALAPQDGGDIGTLLTRADVAMYVAEARGVACAEPPPAWWPRMAGAPCAGCAQVGRHHRASIPTAQAAIGAHATGRHRVTSARTR